VRAVLALGHNLGEWTITVEPTCTMSGVEITTCVHDINHTDMRSVGAFGHDFSDWVIEVAPTCTSNGQEISICRNDNKHKETRTVTALGHDFTDWVETIVPTDVLDGEETRVCRNHKDHTETRVAYATGTIGLVYELNNDGMSYAVNMGAVAVAEVIIPSMHNRLPVTAIAGSYTSNSFVEKVTIPANVIIIGQQAFYRFDNLVEVIFAEDSSLETLERQAFGYCGNLLSFTVPESVKNIGDMAFVFCQSMEELIFAGNNLETIGVGAFAMCESMENIAIPASVKRIGVKAFLTNTAGKTVTISGKSGYEATFFAGWDYAWNATNVAIEFVYIPGEGDLEPVLPTSYLGAWRGFNDDKPIEFFLYDDFSYYFEIHNYSVGGGLVYALVGEGIFDEVTADTCIEYTNDGEENIKIVFNAETGKLSFRYDEGNIVELVWVQL
jgi:hypothetical protein